MKTIISLSGGKDSTAMLIKMLENKIPFDEVIFIDTGVEFDEMYTHLDLIEQKTNIKITRLKAPKSYEYYLLEHEKTKGKTNLKGYSFATPVSRWCTQLLKKSVINKYLKEKYPNEIICEAIGIAYDEIDRIDKERLAKGTVIYPLVDLKITEKQALELCYKHGYTWNGLYNLFDRVSCWCCPLKSLKELKVLYEKYPNKWQQLKEWENKTYRPFRRDYTIHGLEMLFKSEIKHKSCH